MKKLIILSTFVMAITMTACNQTGETGKKEAKPVKLQLTQDELKTVGENSNAAAAILVRKAIEKEMAENTYTEEEKKELDRAIENVKMEFFLNRTASKKAYVDDTEVLQLYKSNAEKLKEADIVQVLPQIKQQLFLQRVNEEKVKYMNSLVDKYKLNDVLKEYFPNQEKTTEVVEKKSTEETTPVKEDTKVKEQKTTTKKTK